MNADTPHDEDDCPFEALGIESTLDAAAVKQAYLAAVRAHPPHLDPEGFKRIRSAFERLQKPKDLARRWLEQPVDLADERRRWTERFTQAIAAAELPSDDNALSIVEQFVAFGRKVSLDDVRG